MILFQPLLIRLLGLLLMLAASCGGPVQQNQTQNHAATRSPVQDTIQIPEFRADSAYAFIERQVSFGPRVPNSQAHLECAQWLEQTLERFAPQVHVQQARVRAWDGTLLNIRNIIGSFDPQNHNRILLAAHWDSRPWADHDPDPANHFEPIDGANDGASGVGVLLEIARMLSQQQPGFGVDIILFDAEDYGQHDQNRGHYPDSWALGSQYWSRNPHRPDYMARYGILLDMVGAKGATFRHEGYSMMYAPNIVREVWARAQSIGYGHYFLNRTSGFVTDDHYYINKIRNIPTINIIHQDDSTPHGFFPQWHTVDDTMEYIDLNTLDAVGQTLREVIFRSGL